MSWKKAKSGSDKTKCGNVGGFGHIVLALASSRRFAAQRAIATEDQSMHMVQSVVILLKHTPFEVISFACFLGNDQPK